MKADCSSSARSTNQAAIIALFRVVNRYVGNLAPMPGVFPDYPAPIVRNGAEGRELATARWGMPSSQHALMEPTKKRAAKLEARLGASPSTSRNCCAWSLMVARPTSAT
jgi:putative SOS response-associated peptidase YedK